MLYSLINGLDEHGTFKVDCNIAGAFLENRPKFKFMQTFSFSPFIFLLLTRKSFKPGKRLSWLLHHSSVLGSRTVQVVSKRSKTNNKMEDIIQLQTPHGFVVSRHFNLCARDQHEYN